jgi:hypothetical protein
MSSESVRWVPGVVSRQTWRVSGRSVVFMGCPFGPGGTPGRVVADFPEGDHPVPGGARR